MASQIRCYLASWWPAAILTACISSTASPSTRKGEALRPGNRYAGAGEGGPPTAQLEADHPRSRCWGYWAINSHRNTETRRGLQPVVDLAGELDCCLLGITHLSKNTSGREPLERVAGSIAFGAIARGVLMTVKPADPDEPRRLVRAKSNNGPDTGGFAYTLFLAAVPGHPNIIAQRIDWGEILEGSARELMAVEDADADAAADAMAEAELFLADLLEAGRWRPARLGRLPTPTGTHGGPSIARKTTWA